MAVPPAVSRMYGRATKSVGSASNSILWARQGMKDRVQERDRTDTAQRGSMLHCTAVGMAGGSSEVTKYTCTGKASRR